MSKELLGPSKCPYSMNTTPSSSNKMTTNRYSMMDAFTAEEFAVLYDLVMFHDECPEFRNLWVPEFMDETVFDKVIEKVSDVMTEFNRGVA